MMPRRSRRPRRLLSRRRFAFRFSELDMIAALRRKLKGRVEADYMQRRAAMFLDMSLAALEHVRRNVKAANYEVGRPVTLTTTARKKRRRAKRGTNPRRTVPPMKRKSDA